MTPDQIEIGEKLLKLLLSKPGKRADRDAVSNFFTKKIQDSSKQVLMWIEVTTVIRLLSHYKILDWETSEKNWLALGIYGFKASEKGLRDFIDEFEERRNPGTTNIIKDNVITNSPFSQSGSSSQTDFKHFSISQTPPQPKNILPKSKSSIMWKVGNWIWLIILGIISIIVFELFLKDYFIKH